MEKIGFFGGCFNPPTIAHLELAKTVIREMKLDKVIYVPMNDSYDKKGLISQEHRLEMLKLLTKDERKLDISNFEFSKKERFYAIDAFRFIDENYKCDKYFIMGSDNYIKINSWKNAEELKKYNFIILDRKNEIELSSKINIISNKKFLEISSTLVRKNIKEGRDVKKFITEDVYKYIKSNNLYLENED